MQNEELKDIQVSHAPHPKRKLLFIISIISLLALVGIVFALNNNKTPDEDPTTVINSEQSPAIVRDSISGWSTYDAGDLTFNYPSDYKVEEYENGVYVISKSNESDIKIYKKKSGNSDFNSAAASVRNGLIDQAEKDLPAGEAGISNGIKMFGVIKNGDEKGDPELSAIIRYGTGALIVKSIGDEINEAIFDQIVSSVTFK